MKQGNAMVHLTLFINYSGLEDNRGGFPRQVAGDNHRIQDEKGCAHGGSDGTDGRSVCCGPGTGLGMFISVTSGVCPEAGKQLHSSSY